jgi:hypothetical protein
VRESGLYATYRGREYRVHSVSRSAVTLPCTLAELEAGAFPDETARQDGPAPRWVEVPNSSLDRCESVHVRAMWRGEEVSVMKVEGNRVGVSFLGPPAFAEANGLEGDQHDGWGGWVPHEELTDVTEEIKELAR